VSRITTGKLLLRREPVDLVGVVRNAIEAIHPLVEASAHRLTVTPGQTAGARVLAVRRG